MVQPVHLDSCQGPVGSVGPLLVREPPAAKAVRGVRGDANGSSRRYRINNINRKHEQLRHEHEGKIVFYEENFQGRSYECMSDCSDMTSNLSRATPASTVVSTDEDLREGNYGGQSYELMDDCDNIMERDGRTLADVRAPSFRGQMMYVRPGEYRSFKDMGMSGRSS
ncbi:hypothetical protein F7725_028396 [Dissostichus mawsoni]|uniref:Beta/gamma crystallin 'Greek key' domain-containing protein n=1 Tax=Dissostichus mawsoni TaxID=36200 RepID=A0A7J5XI09_DISMA|nr:hypothetical protein F7725_028396 [Dissostichus mawsoni]